ncbi:MAG: radical SAM protein [Candidatus Eremiobacteraeota bacterium]|nr:radical SAM protein [Candidatus Eremiobacteraeota bacterium]
MKVLLVNPSLDPREYKNPVAQALFTNAMPLGICYLGAVLERERIDVVLLDAAAERLSHEEVLEFVRKHGIDVVGITSTTNGFFRAVGLARVLKEYGGASFPVMLGGPHVTDMPHHAMSFECFDYGVMGEGEETIVELLSVIAGKRAAAETEGIIYHEEDKVVFTPKRPLIQDLDTIPFPARHLLKNLDVYHSLLVDVKYLPKMSIVANRGCPFRCIFCSTASMGKKYRMPSPERYLEEIDLLKEQYGVREIFFVGSTFTASREHTDHFCDMLLSRGTNVAWTASTRVDVVDKELLVKMKKAGCWMVRLGIESGNDEVIRFIRKAITRERVREVAKMCDEIGMHAKGFFMLGHLPDTKETIDDTIAFALSLPLTEVTVQLNTPLPGTPQYDLAPLYGSFKAGEFSEFNFFEPVFVPKGLTKEYLVRKQRELYRRFYLKPGTIRKHLDKLRSPYARKSYMQALGLFIHLTLTNRASS